MGIFDRLQRELDERASSEGVTMTEVMELPEPLRQAMSHLVRAGSMTLSQLSAELKMTAAETRQLAQVLVDKGLLSCTRQGSDDETLYQARLAHTGRPRSKPSLWDRLEDKTK